MCQLSDSENGMFIQAKREKNKVFHGSDPVEYEISLYLEQDFAKKDLPANAGDLEVERIFIEFVLRYLMFSQFQILSNDLRPYSTVFVIYW